jgi:hypothetical protein
VHPCDRFVVHWAKSLLQVAEWSYPGRGCKLLGSINLGPFGYDLFDEWEAWVRSKVFGDSAEVRAAFLVLVVVMFDYRLQGADGAHVRYISVESVLCYAVVPRILEGHAFRFGPGELGSKFRQQLA